MNITINSSHRAFVFTDVREVYLSLIPLVYLSIKFDVICTREIHGPTQSIINAAMSILEQETLGVTDIKVTI